MRRILGGLVLALSMVRTAVPAVQPDVRTPKVQAAILLDTSSSMSGLIDQARQQLWKMVNEFAKATRNGKRPQIEVALYEYGKSSLPESSGYVRRILPLTTDLDRVSEELFKLSTNGGDEWCGKVIQEAAKGLEWTNEDGDLRAVFIAGNEPFDQGPVSFREACAEMVKRGVIVNTIHCGGGDEGRAQRWAEGALAGGGKYLFIDHNAQAVHVATPHDEAIAKLGVDLNATYLAYGSAGHASAARQSLQDSNSRGAGADSLVQRAMWKASGNYNNAHWDLVDAVKNGEKRLAELDEASLPAEMKGMSAAERDAHVKKQAARRDQLQAQIAKLSLERERWLASRAKAAGPTTLDAVMIAAVRAMAQAHGYRFE